MLDLTGDFVPDVPLIPFALEGFFVGAPIAIDALPTSGLVKGFELATTILDVTHPILTGLYGLPNTLYVGTMVLDFQGFGDAPSGFLTQIQGGVITNQPIPEPGAVDLGAFATKRRVGGSTQSAARACSSRCDA